MEPVVTVLMDLIKCEITGTEIDSSAVLRLSPEEQEKLASLGRNHSVAQLLADALGSCPDTQSLPITGALFPVLLAEMNRVEKIEYEKDCVCQVLNNADIPYIPLKGARIRPFYPEPWMRTSCDNDILVHEEDVELACDLLELKLHYRAEKRNYHDISLFSETGTELELHFSIKENVEQMDRVLDRVWENSHRLSGAEYEQSGEFFVFHQITHMLFHFIKGGCGVRPFADLFLLQEKMDYQEDKLIALCQQAGIAKFYENTKKLIDVWFRNAPHSAVTERMEAYIISGGTFGITENHVAVDQNQAKFRYGIILHRIFATRDHLCGRYPDLKQHPWKLPFYQARRWMEAFRHGELGRLKREWHAAQNIDPDFTSEIEQLLDENGLL